MTVVKYVHKISQGLHSLSALPRLGQSKTTVEIGLAW